MMSEVVPLSSAYLPVSLSGIDRHAPHAHNSTQHPPPPASTTLTNASPISTALGAEQLEDTHRTETDTQLDVSMTMTVGGEPGELGSTTMAERTLVEDEGEGGQEKSRTHHNKGGEGSGLAPTMKGAHVHKKSLGSQVSVEEVHDKPTPSWIPLNTTAGEGIEMQEREKSMVAEEDIVDLKGKLLFADGDTVAKMPVSRRGSHLRLDLNLKPPKPPSPLPWEEIGPPLDNNLKGYYSTETSRFRAMQNSA